MVSFSEKACEFPNDWSKAQEFRLKQQLPYDAKLFYAKAVAREFYKKRSDLVHRPRLGFHHYESKHAGGWHKPPRRKKYKDRCRAAARARRERAAAQ